MTILFSRLRLTNGVAVHIRKASLHTYVVVVEILLIKSYIHISIFNAIFLGLFTLLMFFFSTKFYPYSDFYSFVIKICDIIFRFLFYFLEASGVLDSMVFNASLCGKDFFIIFIVMKIQDFSNISNLIFSENKSRNEILIDESHILVSCAKLSEYSRSGR